MQEAVEFLKILNSSLRFLEPSLQSALTTSYLPKIKINDSVCKPN